MKKKGWLIALGILLLVAVLVIPIPSGLLDNGGTTWYTSLTYKLVNWRRFTVDGDFNKTAVYLFPDNFKSIEALWEKEAENIQWRFTAKVIQADDTAVLVEPLEGEPERSSADRIYANISGLEKLDVQEGSLVEIFYTGGIMESYPAQVNAVKWQLATDLRHLQYTEPWLDPNTAQKENDRFFEHIIITKIYENCFFAQSAIPMPYTIKLNGELPRQWCVGDQVQVTYTNTWREGNRIEADFLEVKESNWEPEPGVAYKPVIYLYPENETEVLVKLQLDGKLTCTYPAYGNGWQVTAAPDGTLIDAAGKSYNYLYWEGQINSQWDMTQGFCVKGEETAAFLEQALEKLGLTRREANEFIVYWLPQMEKNPYNAIAFQTDAYTDVAQLDITPAPDTVIRVFMTWQRLESFVQIPEQDLEAPDRTGFTVVEWGGAQI